MADSFQMDPQATGTGLTAAGRSRLQAVAAAIPALPVGTYINGYSTTAKAILDTLSAEVTGAAGFGLSTTATGVASTETTEAANQNSLTA